MQLALLFQAPLERLVNRVGRAGQASLQDSARQRDALLLAPAGLRQELVDVCGDRLVETILLRVQMEGNGLHVTVGKEPPAVHIAQVFLQPPQGPRALWPQPQDVAADASAPDRPDDAAQGTGQGRAGAKSDRSGHRRRDAGWP